ncbi:TFIID-18kDa-domain-containing protein [Lindgomyces ingoldianus]|uniref:TFIID-18kDa-domain-containing protein n=1 Tax=Lindgomyces ingoldianus TaxID=673940 RepID=A0ACB6QYS4_9PLEO|nr:TFIID-18kDa-domain-containing protein [Lindgomyces ingoldianus]KAF2471685.1 TFIID-18kDa-domain-containing protein [Lindgomyces ingoldianus]
MTEPRMRLRQKGQQFPTQDLEQFLIAFGDDDRPLQETVKCLDEIVTDFIIESCHEAASIAHHARRAKIKVDDFKFMLRRDPTKLGRVSELLEADKELKRKRKAFDTDEGAVAKENVVGKDGATAGAAGVGAGVGGATDGAEGKKGDGGGGKEKEREEGERRKKKKKRNKEGRDGGGGGTGGDDASTVRSG